MTEHQTLSIDEVCESLRVSRPTVYAQINAGRLRSLKIGRRRFVTRQALHDYLRESERAATPGCAA